MDIRISPPAVHPRSRAVLALEPAASETSEDVDDDPDRISKIRARQSVRNKLVVTAMVADRRASATREQEMSDRKVGQMGRVFLTPFPCRAHVSRGLLAMADASDALVRVCVMHA